MINDRHRTELLYEIADLDDHSISAESGGFFHIDLPTSFQLDGCKDQDQVHV